MRTPNPIRRPARALRLARSALPLALIMPLLAWAATPLDNAWRTVANNGDLIPSNSCVPEAITPAPGCRPFNSFNQPSVNKDGLVVFRARSKGGGGEPLQGVYTRDMDKGGPIVRIIDRDTTVPQPNNRATTFIETPAFPRIEADGPTIATRGIHAPTWQVTDAAGDVVEQVGTNGVYANPYGNLVTGESRLGSVAAFPFFQVPGQPGKAFDIVPGAPAVTDHDIIVFKGNYTVGTTGKTGVYYRQLMNAPFPMGSGPSLSPGSGTQPVVQIANSDDYIPGTTTHFGSTAPPSAAEGKAVFLGLDNEEQPTAGGIYLAPIGAAQPALQALVKIGDTVPGEDPSVHFTQLGEGLSFDGRLVAFWGAWGTDTQSLTLQCPQDGNANVLAYCRQQYPDGYSVQIPVHQGMFVHDIVLGRTWAIAKSPGDFSTFLYWNFSGKAPGDTSEEDGELARWRSASFIAVSRLDNRGLAAKGLFHVAFKASTGTLENGAYVDPVDGIYLSSGPAFGLLRAAVTTGMPGTTLDPQAVDPATGEALPVTTVGIERDSFRGDQLVINTSMANEEAGWAGIYITHVRF